MAKFVPGQSGNPEGSRLHKARKLRLALMEAAPDVVKRLIDQAKAGDPAALKLFLDRVVPALRPEAARVELDLPAGTLLERAEAVLALAAAGELPIDTAAGFIDAITKLVAVEQGTELKAQLALLLAEQFRDIA